MQIFSKKNRSLTFIVVTMFLNFLGFSIIIPILPFLVEQYAPNIKDIALNVGLIMAAYAFCQFIAAPGLGALSDKFGRRPILLVSLFGSIIGYLVMAIGGALWVLFLGRIIDGLTGGNISTVFAYIADITKPQERGKYYGLLGAAGGFGFMIGPAVGGLTAHFSLVTPLYLAAFITFLNMVWGYFVLPESLSTEHRTPNVNIRHLNPFLQFNHIFDIPALKRIFLYAFLFFLALMQMQSITSVFLKDIFNWGPEQIGFALFAVGVMDIFSQGYLVRKLLEKLSDLNVSEIGLGLTLIGFVIIALTASLNSLLLLILGVIILVIGDGLFEPSASSLISNSVDRTMQGRVQGASQSMQSMTRVLGPFFAAFLYTVWAGLPYAFGAVLLVGSFAVLALSRKIIHEHKKSFDY